MQNGAGRKARAYDRQDLPRTGVVYNQSKVGEHAHDMRMPFWILSLAVVLHIGGSSKAIPANPSLSFYLVSEENFKGARFINSPDFPRLGYISETPKLVITRLKSVTPGHTEDILVDKQGNRQVIPKKTVTIELYPEDSERLANLSEQIIGKQLLLMIGETPLTAPVVRSPLRTERFDLGVGEKIDIKEVHEALKQLVK